MGDSGEELLCLSGWHHKEQGGERNETQGGLYTCGSVTGLEVELAVLSFEVGLAVLSCDWSGEVQLSADGR